MSNIFRPLLTHPFLYLRPKWLISRSQILSKFSRLFIFRSSTTSEISGKSEILKQSGHQQPLSSDSPLIHTLYLLIRVVNLTFVKSFQTRKIGYFSRIMLEIKINLNNINYISNVEIKYCRFQICIQNYI